MPCLMWFPTDLFFKVDMVGPLPGPPLPRKNDQQTDYQKMRLGSRSHSSVNMGSASIGYLWLICSPLLSLGQLVFMVEFGNREIVLYRPWREIRWEFNRVASGRNFILVCSILFWGLGGCMMKRYLQCCPPSLLRIRGRGEGGRAATAFAPLGSQFWFVT